MDDYSEDDVNNLYEDVTHDLVSKYNQVRHKSVGFDFKY